MERATDMSKTVEGIGAVIIRLVWSLTKEHEDDII
jgi:hypothetical protein